MNLAKRSLDQKFTLWKHVIKSSVVHKNLPISYKKAPKV